MKTKLIITSTQTKQGATEDLFDPIIKTVEDGNFQEFEVELKKLKTTLGKEFSKKINAPIFRVAYRHTIADEGNSGEILYISEEQMGFNLLSLLDAKLKTDPFSRESANQMIDTVRKKCGEKKPVQRLTEKILTPDEKLIAERSKDFPEEVFFRKGTAFDSEIHAAKKGRPASPFVVGRHAQVTFKSPRIGSFLGGVIERIVNGSSFTRR